MKPKKPKAGPRGRAKRYYISLSGEQYAALQARGADVERSVRWLVEQACMGVGVGVAPREDEQAVS